MFVEAQALANKVREYLRLEHQLYRTQCKMPQDEFDAACHRFDELRADIHRLMGEETTE